MPTLLNRLRESALLVADGAWGSSFIAMGLDPTREPADRWNLRFPERVAQLAARYARHADILTTNTFGANAIRLAHFGLEAELAAINAAGVAIARDAITSGQAPKQPALIAGAMGPARGPDRAAVSDGALSGAFQAQARRLAEAGADFLLLETMTDLAEACIAVRAVASVCDLEIVCSFAFREVAPGEYRTWSGDPVEAALGAALGAGATMAGANCIPAADASLALLEAMRRFVGPAPLWFKPNAGQPTRQSAVSGASPGALFYPHPLTQAPLDRMLDILSPGVIGGCCGATPADIANLRGMLECRSRHDP